MLQLCCCGETGAPQQRNKKEDAESLAEWPSESQLEPTFRALDLLTWFTNSIISCLIEANPNSIVFII
jgi:hypothetical protein